MPDDIEIIKKIEEQFEKKLKVVPFEKILETNGYAMNEEKQVVGLNLDSIKTKDTSLFKIDYGQGPYPYHIMLLKNKIKDLTLLSFLTNLIWLNLDGNQITDLASLRKLIQLKKLFLSHNQIEDITPLSDLIHLEELRLTDNQISDISPLSGLIELNSISLSSNRISGLSALIPLTGLKKLWLANNKIYDLTSLKALKHLEILGVRINEISDFTPLKELTNLKGLDISRNNITRLPSGIDLWWSNMEINWVDKPTNVGLNLYGNHLIDPPEEIVKKGRAAIKNYFSEIKAASVLFLESKLLLVGSGDVGKTTLMKKLKNNRFKVKPGKEDTTRGIDIQPWQLSCPFPDGEVRDVKIHFWDFGGQDILHATHQFFLTKRSLYLFVWDPRREEETRSFDYWLNAVKLFGANSPLIMTMNKADIRTKAIDEASFQAKFSNIVQFHQISCLNGQQIPEITQTICRSLGRMPHLLDKLPKRWIDIRNELKANRKDYIPLEDYLAICNSYGMDTEKSLFLSEYLHDLGIILHFQHDPVLAGTVILKPEWATGAVYALIDSLEIQKNKGCFNRANLGRYWDKKKYPTDKHPQLLRLIEKFELCFNIIGTNEYILPELLPAQCPLMGIEIYRSLSTCNLQLHYSYGFMPAGIITRFISRLYYLICDNHYWNNGVELTFSGSIALVVCDTAQKRIRVTVSGTNNSQLMGIIRSNLDHIHETLNMIKEEHFFEEVPCICPKCLTLEKPHLFKYNVLQELMTIGRNILCEKSFKDVSTALLLNGFLPPKEPVNLFDELITIASQVQEIKTNLQTDENSRNTVVALLLQTRGFHVKDQTLSGLSASGNRPGELDIKIIDREIGRTISIIEALNLDCCDTTEIDRHVLKLLKRYDPNGLKELYILVYSSSKDFTGLCLKYREYLPQINYAPCPLKKEIEEVPTGFNKIKAYRAIHQCNDGETSLYHLLVEM